MAALREPLYPAAVTAPGRGFSPSPVQNPSRPAPLYGGAFFGVAVGGCLRRRPRHRLRAHERTDRGH